MILTLLYIIGYIVAYYTTRWYVNDLPPKTPWTYKDVVLNAALSSFSWIWFIFATFLYLQMKGFFNTDKWGKPPSWL